MGDGGHRFLMLVRLSALRAGYQSPLAGPLDLEVRRGEAIGLAGPNGVGKSTFLKVLTGQAAIFGGSLEKAPGLKLLLLEQENAWPDELPVTGGEFLEIAGVPANAIPEALRPLTGKRLDRMSGGEKQLTRLGAHLYQPVDLLLLDEPTNHLDVRHKDILAGLLSSLPDNKGMLAVSHDRHFLEQVTQKVVELAP